MLFTTMSGRSTHSVLVGLLCLAIASAVCCSSVGSSGNNIMCSESERDALVKFQRGLVDESNALASWITEKDCCKWRGIRCNNQTGHITSLNISIIRYDEDFNLVDVPLRGEISHSLLELPYLNYLDLSFNDFQGNKIPEFIGSLSQLKELKLVEANFSGFVPPQLGNLSNLHTLDLSFNYHVSLENLEWLTHLSPMRYLDMSELNLSTVVNLPQSLNKLTSLRELRLSSCYLPDVNLRSLSPLINSSTSLQLLDLSSNHLNSTSIFYWIANVSTNFVRIDLSDNDLEGPIPNVFTSMLSLVTLDLSGNNLEGGIPKGFQNLCRLQSLTLSFNHLSGNIEDSIKALSCANNTLETLDLGFNQFCGSIPELTGFSKLRFFYLSDNNLTGSLPKSVGQLSSLEGLYLDGNSMSGVITESHFRNLSRLQSFDLSDNGFSINISSDWNPPFQLTDTLAMSSCKVGPAFPKWILKQTNLSRLYISNAGISGSLPVKLWDLLPNLGRLDVSMNQIHGILPNLSTTTVRSLNLSSNEFSGEVPSFPSMLRELDLRKNMFSGTLSSLCAIPNSGIRQSYTEYLNILDLSENQLSGELPYCWMQFQNLNSLNMGKNKFSGKIPSWLGNLKMNRILRVHENNFSGEMPSFENCTSLQFVDLGNNNLSGKIPIWIGKSLQNLLFLRLRFNQFNGIIPFSLCNLATIHVLDLSHNKISGGLPHCFNNMTTLAATGGISITQLPYSFSDSLNVELIWKGIEIEFWRNLDGMRSIDMSSNYLIGEIPQSIASMTGLISLNLSRNYLTGKLPEDFGNMKMLESLDLSRNNLSGNIPASFSRLNYLGVLDISHNHLSGKIPIGTQLQSFNASAYTGNFGLCGPPLTPNCSENGTTQADDNKEHDNEGIISLGFFISIVLGFITGFWVVCGSLLLKSSWRYAYFKFLDDSRDWLYVKAVHVYVQGQSTEETSKINGRSSSEVLCSSKFKS